MLKTFLKIPVVILKNLIQKQVFILNCQLLVLEIIRTTNSTQDYFMTMDIDVKILIKIIKTHGGQSTRQFVNCILEKWSVFLKTY